MSDEGDIPTVDVDDLPEGALDNIDVATVGDTDRFPPDMSVEDFSDPNESLVRSFDDDIAKAVQSAVWHTIVDGAGHEAFVDDLTPEAMRDAIERLRSNGFAADRLSATDVWGESDGPPSGAAFFMGDDVADDFEDVVDEWVRIDDGDDADDFDRVKFDGYLAERVENGLPSHLVVLVDVDAIARVPPHARHVPVGLDTTPSVSSPIVVAHEDGIAVINVAQQ